jgi:hypothetical protein
LFFIIFGRENPRFTDQAKELISRIGNWYLDENLPYIRIYGVNVTPHLFPKYVLDILVMGEVCYQIVLQGFNASLGKEAKKMIFTPYRFKIVCYLDTRQETLGHMEYRFLTRSFKRHIPKE